VRDAAGRLEAFNENQKGIAQKVKYPLKLSQRRFFFPILSSRFSIVNPSGEKGSAADEFGHDNYISR
jgi:hypothetical protein